ncbi:MAG: ABC transporter substrate-binding protein [Candidatus Omnitrophica bacterium]|nr:ABC transporter substrate-binding protein [Candidatus Omnitrophota bacterium]
MKIHSLFILIAIVILFASAAGAQNQPIQRIISLGPVITEEMYLLSSENKLVGCTSFCQRPPAAKKKEKVGNVQEVNLEKIVALKPDVVLATELTDPRAQEKLRSLGIRVISVPNARNFEEICDSFLKLGKILGKENKARTIIVEAQKKVDALKARLRMAPRVKVFIQVGVNPLVTIGKDSFANDFIELAGGTNVVTEQGYLQYSKEQVLVSNPDVLLISSMGFEGEHEKKNWEKWVSLNAVKIHKIFIIDQYLLCSPTPITFVETLKTIIRDLHPEMLL